MTGVFGPTKTLSHLQGWLSTQENLIVNELIDRREFLHGEAVLTTLIAARSAGANVLSGSPVAESQTVLGAIFLSPD
jgi:hypothetical protein